MFIFTYSSLIKIAIVTQTRLRCPRVEATVGVLQEAGTGYCCRSPEFIPVYGGGPYCSSYQFVFGFFLFLFCSVMYVYVLTFVL